jgi:hypothetical protein
MVAPIDAKATFEVEGETFTLHLNFRALALAKREGVDLMSGKELDALEMATALRCLAVQAHPDMTDEVAFAIIVKGGQSAGAAIAALFSDFGGKSEGNGKKAKAA